MPKVRLDVLLVERGLAESRAKAQALIMAGQVRVAGQVMLKPATAIPADAALTVDSGPRFVSRGGEKLDAALEVFGIQVSNWVCADAGASTGGFTDCLLQRGAAKVYAIDVGTNQLAWKLRQDPRVVVHEQTNARLLTKEQVPEPVDIVVCDASFIALSKVLEAPLKLAKPGAKLVALVKPQFEAGREEVGKGGVVRDPIVHERVCTQAKGWVESQGWTVLGVMESPIKGPEGNVEFLLGAEKNG